jgi:hypothetical protein
MKYALQVNWHRLLPHPSKSERATKRNLTPISDPDLLTEAYLRQTYGVESEMLDMRRREGGRMRMCVPVV